MKKQSRLLWYLIAGCLTVAAGCDSDSGKHGGNGDPDMPEVPSEQTESGSLVVDAPERLVTDENGTTVRISVKLSRKPKGSVTVSLESSRPEEGSLSRSSIQFDENNWDQAVDVDVKGGDDELADGYQLFEVVIRVSETDDIGFAGAVQSLLFTNEDNDDVEDLGGEFVRIRGSQPWIISEKGSRAEFSVRLEQAPTSDVVIRLTGSPDTEGMIDRTELTFTKENWKYDQRVHVTGVDDSVADGNQIYRIDFDVSSADTRFDKVPCKTREIVNVDDELTPNIHIKSEELVTDEYGTRDGFTIGLDGRPAYDVYVHLASSKPEEAKPEHGIIVFTPDNYGDVEVVVDGIDDDKADGDQKYEISVSHVFSIDKSYEGLVPVDLNTNQPFDSVHGINMDNENDSPAGIIREYVSGDRSKKRTPDNVYYTSEDGDYVELQFRLNKQPKAKYNVLCTVSVTDPTEASVGTKKNYDYSDLTLTFTNSNWDWPQKFKIFGRDDEEVDGDVTYGVNINCVSSDYSLEVQRETLVFVNRDNDGEPVEAEPGLIIEKPYNVLYTNEDGMSKSFTVALHSQPTSDVIVKCTSLDPSEGIVTSGGLLTFTRFNWNIPQTVMVTGRDDSVADGNVQYQVIFSVLSDDKTYQGVKAEPVALLNFDNEMSSGGNADNNIVEQPKPNPEPDPDPETGKPYFVTEPNSCSDNALPVSKTQPYTYYVHLNRQPKSEIRLEFRLNDPKAASLDENSDLLKKTLVFKPENYDMNQSVTIYGRDIQSNIIKTSMNITVSAENADADAGFIKAQNELCFIPVDVYKDEYIIEQKKTQHLRIMAANTTTAGQRYNLPGMNMFYAMDPDIILVQEFAKSASYVINGRPDGDEPFEGLESYFKTKYYYFAGRGGIGNGIVSKYPILWTKSNRYAGDRDWDAALIDIPGDKDLLVLSLHLLIHGHSGELSALPDWIRKIMDGNDYYIAIGGDFNTSSIYDGVGYLNSVVVTNFEHPHDQYNNANTNHGRVKQYDWLLVDPAMHAYSTPTVIGEHSYSHGYVLDSRVQNPLSAISPVRISDSDDRDMQHMPVIRDFIYEY